MNAKNEKEINNRYLRIFKSYASPYKTTRPTINE